MFETVARGGEITADQIDDLNRELHAIDASEMEALGEAWDGTAAIIESAGKNMAEYEDAYADMFGEMTDMVDAQAALNVAQDEAAKGTEEYNEALSTLASYTGISEDVLRNNLSPAVQMLSNDMTAGGNSVGYLFSYLSALTGVHFTTENWRAQLSALASSSNATAAQIAQLILNLASVNGTSLSFDGNKVNVNWGSGGGAVAKAPSGGGGGGGGGGGASKSAAERLVEKMDSHLELANHARELAQAAQSYHDVRGEIQGVIAYLEKERDIVGESSEMLEGYLGRLEREIESKQKTLAGLKEGSKAYNNAAEELGVLQEAHQKYSLELLQNKTDIEKLTQSIKEQNDTIREMEIELRNTILDAIEDREDREERQLEGRIELENQIIDVITKRYEKERDEILETADLRAQTLQDEIDAIDEKIAKLKEAAEEEDKLEKIEQLEAKLARISLDPTRVRETRELQEEIAQLREDLAWEAAEKEAEAQKESLQEQIDNIEDYKEYIEEYYEELLENPRKLIEGMEYLLESTDEEILGWLKENSEEFANSTAATQESMIKGWQETLDNMRDVTRTYWEEIEMIISQGDEAIISFLKENSQDYREAGKLQAEAYVDEWRKQLDDLEAAYRKVTANIESYNYSAVSGDGGSTGGGGGGGTGGSGGTYTYGYRNVLGRWVKATSASREQNAFLNAQREALAHWNNAGQFGISQENIDSIMASIRGAYTNNLGRYLKKYAAGGIIDSTGPIMVHGTPNTPERILSAQQNKLFETMVAALQTMVKVPVFGMSSYGADGIRSGGNTGNVMVTVNVGAISDDYDINDLAKKVGAAIMKETSRGSSVAGIRISR